MHAVGYYFLRQLGVGGLRLFQRGDDRRVQVRDAEFLPLRQFFDKLAVTHQHRVVAAFKSRRLRHVIKRRRLNHRDANAGQRRFHRVNDVLVALGVGIENLFIERAIGTVVHPEHDGHHGGFVRNHVASQSQIHRPTAPAGHAVTAPTGMDKTDVQFRKPRQHVRFGESRVEALIRNAVAIEHDPVAILEGKVFRPGLQGDECDKPKRPNE